MLKQYTYTDHKKYDHAIIYVTMALNITEADKAFKEIYGKCPSKVPTVGCQVKEI